MGSRKRLMDVSLADLQAENAAKRDQTAQESSERTCAITLGIINPTLLKEAIEQGGTLPIRFADDNECSPTECYNVKYTNATVDWPQSSLPPAWPNTGPLGATSVAAALIPQRTPVRELSFVITRQDLCRWREEWKNTEGKWTGYQAVSDAGSYDFYIPCQALGRAQTVDISPSRWVYDKTIASRVKYGASGLTATPVAVGPLQLMVTLPEAQMTPAHEQWKPVFVSKSNPKRNYDWCDGCWINGGTSAIVVAGSGIQTPFVATVNTQNGANAVSAGATVFCAGTVPLLSTTVTEITVYGYNNGREYIYYTNTWTGVAVAAGDPFAVIPINVEDSYAYTISMTDSTQTVTERCIQLFTLNSGQMWRIRKTVDLEKHAGTCDGIRGFGTSILLSQGTPKPGRGGFWASCQNAHSKEWQEFFDTGRPFEYVVNKNGAQSMPLDNGAYSFLQCRNAESFQWNAGGEFDTDEDGNIVKTQCPLDDVEFKVIVVQAPDSSDARTQLQYQVAMNGEVSTDDKWAQVQIAMAGINEWNTAIKWSSRTKSDDENPRHNLDSILSVIGQKAVNGLGVSPGAVNGVKGWIKRMLPQGLSRLASLAGGFFGGPAGGLIGGQLGQQAGDFLANSASIDTG